MSKQKKSPVGIRISSEPIRTGKLHEPELPLHIVYVGDLLGGGNPPAGMLFPLRLDKNSFGSAVRDLAPSLRLEVPERLTGTLKSLEVMLKFPDLKAFHPEGVIAQVPLLQRMLAARTLILQLRRRELTLEEFRPKAEAAGIDRDLAERFAATLKRAPRPAAPPPPARPVSAPAPPKRGASPLDALLDMVNLGQEPSPNVASPVDALVTAVTGDQEVPGDVDRVMADTLIGQLDQVIGAQVTAILHDADFRRLETVWRSVKLLVDRLDFRKNIVLSILPCRRGDLSETLRRWITIPSRDRTHPLLQEAPVSVVLIDFQFSCLLPETDLLQELAEQVSSIGAVCFTDASPAFFGVKSAAGLRTLPPVRQLLRQPEYTKWNSFSGSDTGHTLALALPRFLLRYPYGKENEARAFAFTESLDAPDEQGLWANGSLIAALALAGLFAEGGWKQISGGFQIEPVVEDLPLWNHGEREGLHPLEVLIPSDKRADLCEAGFVALSGTPNYDGVRVSSVPPIGVTETNDRS